MASILQRSVDMTTSRLAARRASRTFLAIAALFAGCGADPSPPGADIPDPRTCSLTWRTVYSPPQGSIVPLGEGQAVQAHGTSLFINNLGALEPDKPAILAVPIAGGPSAPVHVGGVWAFWFEDDDLIFNEGSVLYRMPPTGGTPQALLTYHLLDTPANGVDQDWTLDREALYLIRLEGGALNVWRAARDGSGETKLASLPFDPVNLTVVTGLFPVGDRILVTTTRHAYSVSKMGGGTLDLPAPTATAVQPRLQAIASDGTMLWSQPADNLLDARTDILQITADGSSTVTLWSASPFDDLLSQAWSDGTGGWYATVLESSTDLGSHTTVWSLHAGASPRRVSCDPEIGRWIESGFATPDATYVIANGSNFGWEIAAISPGH